MLVWVVDLALTLPVPCRFLALHVDEQNGAAIRFYERHQFFHAARRTRDDATVLLFMLRDLLPEI
jgi:ribosomal protein S18 acetylase RimI-like enzyme